MVPVFILEPGTLDAAGPWGPLLKGHLQALREALRGLGSDLVVLEGRPEELLPAFARRWQASSVRTLRSIGPAWRDRDLHLAARLDREGVAYEVLEGDTLLAPGSLRTQAGGPFRVFTPFARAFQHQALAPLPWPVPERLAPLPLELRDLPWPWPAEPPALGPGARVAHFLEAGLRDYADGRNRLGEDGTSRLSVALASGTLSVRTLWKLVQAQRGKGFDPGVTAYLNELLWREFAHHTLWANPELVTEPFRASWRGFPWRQDPAALAAWKEGRTGYPVVDAAARELLATGHVHNRARMIAATFLTKHLLVDWREGEAHYRRI